MSVVVSNWYLSAADGNQTILHWWTRDSSRNNAKPGTSTGRDHLGREGTFTENTMPILFWQEYDGDMWAFTGPNDKRAIAALSTHYKNPKYPAQCVSGKSQLVEQLVNVKKR